MIRWVDLHCHTHLSLDGVSRPRAILRRARAAGLAAVAVTDHGTIAGAIQTAALRQPDDPEVIVGAEYSTDAGHILGLFLREEIDLGDAPRWPWREVVAAIRAQGGIAVLAHPTKTIRPLVPDVLAGVDGMEVYNARAEFSRFARANARALAAWRAWCLEHPDAPLIATAGSDAHLPAEIGHARCAISGEGSLREALRQGPIAVQARGTAPLVEATSQAVKTWRGRQWAKLPQAVARLGWHGARTATRLGRLGVLAHWSLTAGEG